MPSFYCSVTDMEDIMSSEGITFSVDDDHSGNRTADELTRIENAIERAEAMIDMALQNHYSTTQFANGANKWVKWCCAYLAVYELGFRLGQAPSQSTVDRVQQYMNDLDLISQNIRQVPGATQLKEHVGMSMSNLVYDGRHRTRKIRVDQSISTQPHTSDVPRQFKNHPHPGS